MAGEIEYAETVILIDASYLDRVGSDMAKHFSQVVNRDLPKADLPMLLECLALDAGVKLGNNAIQVLFIYDEESKRMNTFQPGDLKTELDCVAFESGLGEFAFYSFEPSGMVGRDELFLESLKEVANEKRIKRLLVVPSEEEYGDEAAAILEAVDGKDSIMMFGMNPPLKHISYKWETMGYAVLQSLGVKANEL